MPEGKIASDKPICDVITRLDGISICPHTLPLGKPYAVQLDGHWMIVVRPTEDILNIYPTPGAW